MRCLRCGTENAQDAKFCKECAAPLGAAPPSSADTLAGRLQRLIPQEYADLLRATRGQVTHERRLVTILFCDVKGSTAMAEEMDPEEVLELMDGAFDFLISPVYCHEGTLARLMGDAILAFFGAPLAHEDDPERAIRAGLEILVGAREYARRLEQERGIPGFSVRVGIHTGPVVVGEVGSDLRAEYTAMGDAVNLAARMEQSAPPGGLLITHATYRHVRGAFDVEPQPPLQVKGKKAPVQAYLVLGAKPRAWRVPSRGVEGVETRMVGRDAELLSLQTTYREVVEGGEARVVTVTGEPGVGKSRLLDEFTTWVDLEALRVSYLRGRASAEARAVAYSLWRDLFASRFDILETDSAAEALSKFRTGMAGLLEPQRADLVGHLVGFDFSASLHVSNLLGSESFAKLATAYLVQYLCGLAAQQPAVMLLEDLHWADDSSLDLLAEIVLRLRSVPILIVAAARPELFERRPSWGEGQACHARLKLRPLGKRAGRTLVREILHKVRDLPRPLEQVILGAAEGNPFYAEELVKMLIDDGTILTGEEEWRVDLDQLARVRVPSTLTAVLQARLDALPREEKEVLQRASVVGREFWSSLVSDLASDAVPPEEVRPLLGALRGKELVYRRERSAFAGTEEYLFKHAVLRDVTYETVLLRLRRRYHAQVAAWLEGHAGERLVEYLSLIAGHHELAGEREKAARYHRRVGEELYNVGNFRAARGAFEHALALLPTPSTAGRADEERANHAELVVWLGRARISVSEWPEAWQQFEAALTLARAAGDPRLEAQALAWLGKVRHNQHRLREGEPLARQSLDLARETGDRETLALSLRFLADVLHSLEQDSEATALATECRALCEESGDRQTLVRVLRSLALIAETQRAGAEATLRFGEALALAEEIGDLYGAGLLLVDHAILAGNAGQWAERRAYLERGRAIVEKIGDPTLMAYVLEQEAFSFLREERYDQMCAYLERAITLYEAMGNVAGMAGVRNNLGCTLMRMGKHGAAWAQLTQAMRESLATEYRHLVSGAVGSVGEMGVCLGRLRRAAELLELSARPCLPWMDAEEVHKDEWAILRAALPAEELQAARARGAALDLDRVVAEILACDTPEKFWGPEDAETPSRDSPTPGCAL